MVSTPWTSVLGNHHPSLWLEIVILCYSIWTTNHKHHHPSTSSSCSLKMSQEKCLLLRAPRTVRGHMASNFWAVTAAYFPPLKGILSRVPLSHFRSFPEKISASHESSKSYKFWVFLWQSRWFLEHSGITSRCGYGMVRLNLSPKVYSQPWDIGW